MILRRRNWCNASFCCGAGSIHRREAVVEAALRAFSGEVEKAAQAATHLVEDAGMRADMHEMVTRESAREAEVTPYKFHVSEDIYTSFILHSDSARKWRSRLARGSRNPARKCAASRWS